MTFLEVFNFIVGFYVGYKFGIPIVKFIKDFIKELK